MFEIAIVCEKCGERKILWNTILPKKYAIKIAREDGWAIGKKTLCPACKPKKESKDA